MRWFIQCIPNLLGVRERNRERKISKKSRKRKKM